MGTTGTAIAAVVIGVLVLLGVYEAGDLTGVWAALAGGDC